MRSTSSFPPHHRTKSSEFNHLDFLFVVSARQALVVLAPCKPPCTKFGRLRLMHPAQQYHKVPFAIHMERKPTRDPLRRWSCPLTFHSVHSTALTLAHRPWESYHKDAATAEQRRSSRWLHISICSRALRHSSELSARFCSVVDTRGCLLLGMWRPCFCNCSLTALTGLRGRQFDPTLSILNYRIWLIASHLTRYALYREYRGRIRVQQQASSRHALRWSASGFACSVVMHIITSDMSPGHHTTGIHGFAGSSGGCIRFLG